MPEPEEVNLTAAGAGVGLNFGKRLVKREDLLVLMEQAAIDGLQAMAPSRWDKNAGTWTRDPDYRVRTQTLFGLLAQLEGEPVKRIAISGAQRKGIETDDAALARLLQSPAVRAKLRKQLDDADQGKLIAAVVLDE